MADKKVVSPEEKLVEARKHVDELVQKVWLLLMSSVNLVKKK